MAFETHMKELRELTQKLEQGNLPLEEAVAYYQHPIPGARLREITAVLLEIPSNNPWSVFGQTDARKVRSCMTLFRQAAPDDDLFSRVLYKFYRGVEDKRTLEQLHIF